MVEQVEKAGVGDREIFIRLLKKQTLYYQAILDATREERAKFTAHRPLSEITPLMNKKKIFLGCIEEINVSLSPLKAAWQQSRGVNDPLEPEIHEVLNRLDRMFREILELDTANSMALKEILSQMGTGKGK